MPVPDDDDDLFDDINTPAEATNEANDETQHPAVRDSSAQTAGDIADGLRQQTRRTP
jgi:hypothetical protein